MGLVDHLDICELVPINWEDFDPDGGSDTDDRSPSPPPKPMVHADEFPGDLDAASVPADWKTEGDDWLVLYNPRVPRSLDISLIYDFSHECVVYCVRFSKDGMFLAAGGLGTTQIFDLLTGSLVSILNEKAVSQEGDLCIRAVCFSPDGKHVATAAQNQLFRIWDISQRSICHTFVGHEQTIEALEFSHDGSFLVSGSSDRTARIWDMNTYQSKVLCSSDDPTVDTGVTSVSISPDMRFVATAHVDCIVRIWDVATGSLADRLRGHTEAVYSVAFTPDSKGIVSGAFDGKVKYWELNVAVPRARKVGERLGRHVVDCNRGYVSSISLSRDGQWVASGSLDGSVEFWDKHGRAHLALLGHRSTVLSIDLNPRYGYFATGSGDLKARVWRYLPPSSDFPSL